MSFEVCEQGLAKYRLAFVRGHSDSTPPHSRSVTATSPRRMALSAGQYILGRHALVHQAMLYKQLLPERVLPTTSLP